uniref:Uncharacterized protein n=1 Tax=Gopherus evgoodei TaxID=1825980 RepID=A0A8C4VQX8_9SAUR
LFSFNCDLGNGLGCQNFWGALFCQGDGTRVRWTYRSDAGGWSAAGKTPAAGPPEPLDQRTIRRHDCGRSTGAKGGGEMAIHLGRQKPWRRSWPWQRFNLPWGRRFKRAQGFLPPLPALPEPRAVQARQRRWPAPIPGKRLILLSPML